MKFKYNIKFFETINHEENKTRVHKNSLKPQDFKESTKEYLNICCNEFGSDLQGKLKFSKSNFAISNKPPVILDESQGIAFYPTAARGNKNNKWIAYHQVLKISKGNYGEAILTFKDNTKLILEESYKSILIQHMKTSHLLYSLHTKKELLAIDQFFANNTQVQKYLFNEVYDDDE